MTIISVKLSKMPSTISRSSCWSMPIYFITSKHSNRLALLPKTMLKTLPTSCRRIFAIKSWIDLIKTESWCSFSISASFTVQYVSTVRHFQIVWTLLSSVSSRQMKYFPQLVYPTRTVNCNWIWS
jgi:hypothetical protein